MTRDDDVRVVKRSPTGRVASRLKRRLRRLAKEDHERSARVAQSVLADESSVHYEAFVARPYVRNQRVTLSKPKRLGWYYVRHDDQESAAVCVGHAEKHGDAPVLVQSATF